MGQYHYTVNLDKREFLNPHQLGDGLKLVEQCGHTPGGTNDALHLLLAVSNGRGGGDFPDSEWVGRWGGDRIAVVGDYAEDDDLPAEFSAGSIYSRCYDPEDGDEKPDGELYTNITPKLLPVLEQAYELVYYGTGWRRRGNIFKVFDITSTFAGDDGRDGGRVAEFKDGSIVPVSQLIEWARGNLQGGETLPVPLPETLRAMARRR